MAVRTSVGSGNWSVAGTWDTGVPADGDTAIIANTHAVTFDVDQSGFANGVTVTINDGGILAASTAPGAYILKMQAAMTVNGTLRAGTIGVPYPTACSFEIQRGGFDLNIGATGILDLNCTEPTTRFVRLTAQALIGAVVLNVDTDVTADIWADSDIIRVDDVNAGMDSEERVIAVAGIAANTITITVGLAAQKEIGALVILVSRNVKITHNAPVGYAINGGSNGQIGAEIRNADRGTNFGSSHTITGTVSGCSYGVYAGSDHVITGTVSGCSIVGAASFSGHTISGVISGCNHGVYFGSGGIISGIVSGCNNGIYFSIGCVVSGTVDGCYYGFSNGAGCTISGTISGCNNGIYYGASHVVSGTISGCTTGVYFGSGIVLGGATLANTSDLNTVAMGTCYDTLFNGVTEFAQYNSVDRLAWHYVESFDHDQVANAFKAWCRGGIVNSNLVTVPPDKPLSYQHACESAAYPCFRQIRANVEPGKTLAVTAQMRKDALMAWLPRVQIIDPYADPLVDGANPPLATALMTDSLNTWETVTTSWQNAGTIARWVLVRVVAMNAANNLYEYIDIITGGRRPRARRHGV